MKKYLSLILVLCLSLCAFAAIAEEKPIKIGVLLARADEFNLDLERNWQKLGEETEGVEVITTVAQDNQSQQIANCEALIAQGVDAITVRAVDQSAAKDMISMIHDAGILVVLDEGAPDEVTPDMYDLYIKSENIQHGENIGLYLKDYIAANPDKQLYLGYIQGTEAVTTIARHDGIYNIVTEDQVKELDYQLGEWKADKAASITEGWLTSYPEMNVIACANDTMACAVVETLLAAGIDTTNDFLVFGVDGDQNALQYILNGTLAATSGQDASISTRVMFENVIKLLKGEPVEFDDPENKIIDPRMIKLITIDNAADFVK